MSPTIELVTIRFMIGFVQSGVARLFKAYRNSKVVYIDEHGSCTEQSLPVNYNMCAMADRHRRQVTVFSRNVRLCRQAPFGRGRQT
jgi:hypothetical protein